MPDVFGEFLGILQPTIPRSTVRDEPSHLLGFIFSIVNILRLGDDTWIIILPGFIRGHYCTVLSVMKRTFFS